MSPALRTFASVISGYFLMAGIVIAVDLGVGVAFADAFAMAPLEDGVGEPVPQFSGGASVLLVLLAGSVLAAIAGGALSGKVAGGAKGPRILAALVLVLGVMSNVGGALAYPDTVPAWYLWSLPFCGMLGVMVGAQLVSPGSGGEDGSGGAPASS